jgi:hypothetical protein
VIFATTMPTLEVLASQLAACMGLKNYPNCNRELFVEGLVAQMKNQDHRLLRKIQQTRPIDNATIVQAAVDFGVPEIVAKLQSIQKTKVDTIKRSIAEVQQSNEEPEEVKKKRCEAIECLETQKADAAVAELGESSLLRKTVHDKAETLAIKAAKGDADAKKKLEKSSLPPVYVNQQMGMAHGTVSEDYILKALVKRGDFADAYKPSGTRGKIVGKVGAFDILLKGEIDALGRTPGAGAYDTIIEIKRRQYKLFHTVPDYDRVQVLAYCHLHGMEKACLAEAYGDDIVVHQVPCEPFDAIWASIESAVRDALAIVQGPPAHV